MSTAKPEPDTEQAIRPFADVLQELQGGRTHNDLSEALHDLTTAVREHGKAGSIQLTIKIDPVSKGDGTTVTVTSTVASKTPKAEPKKSIFFLSDDGNLQRDDPRQLHLPLREVTLPEAPIREAGNR